jgi:hypothetical protein
MVRHLRLNLFEKVSSKLSLKQKQFKAALSDDFREEVVFGLKFLCVCPVISNASTRALSSGIEVSPDSTVGFDAPIWKPAGDLPAVRQPSTPHGAG